MRIISISFSEDKRKNGAIYMFPSRVLCGSGCEPSLVLHKEPQNFEFQRPERVLSASFL
jgi:hypothetical protein